jgi:hypothetical protein
VKGREGKIASGKLVTKEKTRNDKEKEEGSIGNMLNGLVGHG